MRTPRSAASTRPGCRGTRAYRCVPGLRRRGSAAHVLIAVKSNRSIPSAVVIPVLIYPDVREAVAWLGAVFGFGERVRIGEAHRSQLAFGDGAVIVGDVRHERRPPRAGRRDALGDGARASMRTPISKAGRAPGRADREGADRLGIRGAPVHIRRHAGHRWTLYETLADVAPEEWGGVLIAPE